MKTIRMVCVVGILAAAVGCTAAGNEPTGSAATPNKSESLATDIKARTEPTPEIKQSVTYKGVSLRNKITTATGIEPVPEPAQYLEQEDDKPDSAVPDYLSLKFRGQYQKASEESFYQPEVNIYPIEEFRIALGKSKNAVRSLEHEIEQLKAIISSKQKHLKVVPRIPFHDGSPTTITHVKYVQFENGQGVQYLTHFDIEQAIIGNERLTYVMQGLTSDGRYYIFATFPVALDFLPHSDASEFRGYKSPIYFYEPGTRAKNEKNYERYLSSMTELLEATQDDKFNPNLTSIQNTLSTLNANWQP